MMSADGWRAKAYQWLRVARRKTADERAAAIRAAAYCRQMSIKTRAPIGRATAC